MVVESCSEVEKKRERERERDILYVIHAIEECVGLSGKRERTDRLSKLPMSRGREFMAAGKFSGLRSLDVGARERIFDANNAWRGIFFFFFLLLLLFEELCV